MSAAAAVPSSSSSSSSNRQPTTRERPRRRKLVLCRYDDDDPIELIPSINPEKALLGITSNDTTNTSTINTSTIQQFENWLEQSLRLDVTGGATAVLYATRTEAMLLKCQPPLRMYNTILGILEEQQQRKKEGEGNSSEEEEGEDEQEQQSSPHLPLDLRVWTTDSTSTAASAAAAEECACSDAFSTSIGSSENNIWIRQPLLSTEATVETSATEAHDQSTTSTPANNNKRKAAGAVVDWIDLRSRSAGSSSTLSLPLPITSAASVCHFLRCLLPVDEDVSPWPTTTTTTTTTTDDDGDDESADACVLCLDGEEPPATLLDFRVADANPSWYLFSICFVTLPPVSSSVGDAENDGPSAFAFTAANSNNNNNLSKNATLLVYRKLPPRTHLTTHHPITNELVSTPGCLWETITAKKKPKGEEGEANGGTADDQQNDETENVTITRVVGPPYYEAFTEYPNLLEPLVETINTIRREAMTIGHWTAWPEQQHYSSSSSDGNGAAESWTVFPLCYCFPANDVSQRKWVTPTCQQVPQTVALLKQCLGDTLRTALFSRLQPNSTLNAHTGWQDLANHVLRVHLPLIVPDGNLCGTWVDGCVVQHNQQQNHLLCFDDSKTHWAYNYSPTESRIVLILDLERPTALPTGTAVGGHSEELDKFIEKMTG